MVFFAVAHPEQRCFENIQVPLVDELVEELEKVSDHQVPDMKAVDIRICSQNHLFIAEVLDGVLNPKTAHEIIHFIILVDRIALEIPDIQRLTLQGKNGLTVDVTTTDNRSGSGHPLGDEDHGVEPLTLIHVEVLLAVLKLGDTQTNGFGTFPSQFF